MRYSFLFCLLAVCGCGSRPAAVAPETPRHWFRIVFGAQDKDPADWSGSMEAAGGRVAALLPWRFDKDDAIEDANNSWKCSTRLASTHDPRDWFVGAIHIVPKDMKQAKGALIPNGVYAAVENASEVKLTTGQGSFSFRPAEVDFGAGVELLNGRVRVIRVPAPASLSSDSGREDDYPAIAADAEGRAWVAWVSYKGEKEQLIAARADGAEKQVVAEGEFFRPAIAAGKGGRLWLAASVNTGASWRIGVASRQGSGWSKVEFISAGGPDLQPRLASDAEGRVWAVWQGYRDGRSRIFARMHDGAAWQPELAVSENTANAWEPSLAVDPKGGVHFVWDAYDKGDYDVYYRYYDGRNLGAQRALASSPLREARAFVATDPKGQAWITWDEGGPNWGKDTGFLVDPKNGATRLYDGRRLRLAVVAGGSVSSAAMPEEHLEYAQLASDAEGRIWLLAMLRETKLHAVYSPSLQRDRLQQYSLPGYVAAHLTSSGWSPLIPLPYSWGRMDLRASIAALPGGKAAVAWAGDGRSFAKPYPYVKNNVYTSTLSGAEPASLPLVPFEQQAIKAAVVHPKEAEDIRRLQAARINTKGKSLRILRGDMHRHTDLSFDGDIDGSIWDFYRYAIDAAGFEYSGLTDHNAGDDTEYIWWIIQKSNDLFHYPGRFTPVFAYERSLRYPNGHRNLVWAKRGVRTLTRSKEEESGAEGAARLYDYLRKTGGLAMSHTSATLMGTDWRDNDPELEPLVEIYQGDRTSYEFEGAPRAATAAKPFSQPGGFQPKGFIWNAWAKGYKLGVQASSDHASTHVSYAVLLAEDWSREGVLNAIRARHAYGSTDNILLDFRCGDQIHGDIFTTPQRPRLSIRIHGTAPVAKVEIVKNNKSVFSARPGKAEVELAFEDTSAQPGESYYYVRVEQADGQLAWSSPMWITYRP
jgi:hypothetical protein